jgi:hypothetical protein
LRCKSELFQQQPMALELSFALQISDRHRILKTPPESNPGELSTLSIF